MKKSEAACRRIRAATTESQVIAAVRDYVASLEAPEIAGLPVHVLSSSLVHTEESIHAALQIFEDAVGRVTRGKPGSDTADGMKRVLTAAARRLATLSAKGQ